MLFWYFLKGWRLISNTWHTSWRYFAMLDTLSNRRSVNSSQTASTTWVTSFTMENWRFYNTPSTRFMTWSPNEYYLGKIVLGLSPRFSGICTQLRSNCSAAEQNVAKRPINLLQEIRRRRINCLKNTAKKAYYASIIIPSDINGYLHAGYPGLWSPNCLGPLSATDSRTRQTDWLLVESSQRRGTHLQHHTQRMSHSSLGCITTEATPGRRLIQNQNQSRRSAVYLEPCGYIRKACEMALTFIWIQTRCLASSQRQTPSCRHIFATPNWQGR